MNKYLELLLGLILDIPAIIANLFIKTFITIIVLIKMGLTFILGLSLYAAKAYFVLIILGLIGVWTGLLHLEVNYYVVVAQLIIPIFLINKGLPFLARVITNFVVPNLFLNENYFRDRVKKKFGMNHAKV